MALKRHLITGIALLCFCTADLAAQTPRPSPADTGVSDALRANSPTQLVTALTDLWAQNPLQARRQSLALLGGNSAEVRRITLAILAQSGDSATLSAVLADLRPSGFVNERPPLIRALARIQDDTALQTIEKYIHDADPATRAAAIQAMAAQKRLLGVELIQRHLGPMSDYTDIAGADELFFTSLNAHGAIKSLTEFRGASSNDFTQWWREARRDVAATTPAVDLFAATGPVMLKNGMLLTRDFLVEFNPPSLAGQLPVQLRESGINTWIDFANALDREAAAVKAACARIYGCPLSVPLTRLEIVNEQTLAARGGNAMGAQRSRASETRIAFFIGVFEHDWRPTLRHEYTHVTHLLMFRNQPRWLLEGIAMSVQSGEKPNPDRLGKDPVIAEVLAKGVATMCTQWTFAPGEGDGPEYVAAYLLIDCLRNSGGLPVPAARLCELMDRIARGQPSTAALEEVYGLSVREIDSAVVSYMTRDQSLSPGSDSPRDARGAPPARGRGRPLRGAR